MLHTNDTDNDIRPISALGAAGWFALYGGLLFVGFHFIMPQLWRIGLNSAESLILVMTIPLALMLIPPIISYWREDRPKTLRAMLAHWRYQRLSWRDLAWMLFIIAIGLPAVGLMSALNLMLIEKGWITIPDYVPPLFNPLADLTDRGTWDAISGGIVGNWRILTLYFILLFFNITGEEVLWRGWLLPRQEAQHGRWAWIIHGLMWTLFHAFNWWGMLPLLPICLLIAWTTQHTGRSWPAYIAHYLINSPGFLIALSFVAGWMG